MAASAPLIVSRPAGLYCPAGDFYIDPSRPVKQAVITHAHGDHASGGSEVYYCAAENEALLRKRIGKEAPLVPTGGKVRPSGCTAFPSPTV